MAGESLSVVLVTLDSHLADAFGRARAALSRDYPSVQVRMHVAADWRGDAAGAAAVCDAIASADILVCTQLFQDEHVRVVRDAVAARRDQALAVACIMCAPELVRLTRLGRLDMSAPESTSPFSPAALLRRLRGGRKEGRSNGERQMSALRTLPSLLRFVPGKAQDMRAWLLTMQYWLSGSDRNIEAMIRALLVRYAGARLPSSVPTDVPPPVTYPETGLWHPELESGGSHGIVDDVRHLPARAGGKPVVGVLVGRSYLLAGNTAHYRAVVHALEGQGLTARCAFASALDARPAIDAFFRDAAGKPTIDALVNLTGFSLVGGPAYNDAAASVTTLDTLDVPVITAQALEFQSIDEWQRDPRGLNALQTTLQIAIPELEGATGPIVFAAKTKPSADSSNALGALDATHAAVAPGTAAIADRVDTLARRVAKLARLRRTPRDQRKIAITLFNFPPNAGNTGTAAYLAVFPSLQRVLASLKEQGYAVELPASADELRIRLTEGNRERYGAPANVHTLVPAADHVRREPYLEEIERAWGAAPGRVLTDGQSLFITGIRLGNVFVGVQPAFGWEGDPMRLLFERGFAPTHAFNAYYRWAREDFGADAFLHFGTHGALEFMPGKQSGLTADCWPDRLIGDVPNVYLYASNNPSEGTLAKRRANATLVSYLTPPVARSGLYRGLADLKASLDSWATCEAGSHERASLVTRIAEDARALDLIPANADGSVANAWTDADADREIVALRSRLLEVEYALIPSGLHIVGEAMDAASRIDTLFEMAQAGQPSHSLAPISAWLAPLDGARGESRSPADASSTRGEQASVVSQNVEGVARALIESIVRERDPIAAVAAARIRAKLDRVRITDERAMEDAARALCTIESLLGTDREIEGLLRALDGRYVPPAPGGDLLRTPEVLPTGRNMYAFDPYRVPSARAMLEGQRRAALLLDRAAADGAYPESVAMVLWGTDNMKSDGAPIAQALALFGAAPRFDSVGRLSGARLLPLEVLGRPRVDVVLTLSGIFRDLLPLQTRLLAEAALLCAEADEDPERNFVRKHVLATMQETGCDLATAALRVFSNAEGAYGSNVNMLIENGRWENEDELANQFVQRKSFAYDVQGRASAQPDAMRRALAGASVAYQGLDSIELGATDVDQYVESLGGMTRVIAAERGKSPDVFMGDFSGATSRIRSLADQIALETRSRTLNPRWYEAQLAHGYEGVRNIAVRTTATLGWSATAGRATVPDWVYQEIGRTFVLDPVMRERLARLNPTAAHGIAQRLLEANDRGLWEADAETIESLRDASADLEDHMEGIHTPR